MTFPHEAVVACDALAARHPDLAFGTDDQRRTLTELIGQQVAFALGPRWGNKKRHGLGPEYRSKDALAYDEQDGTITVWDWQNGTTRLRGVAEGAAGERLSSGEADFMPVTPINHLGTVVEPPVDPPVDPPPVIPPVVGGPDAASFDRDVRASLGRVEVEQGAAKARDGQMAEQLDALEHATPADPAKAVDYETKLPGGLGTLTSKPKS